MAELKQAQPEEMNETPATRRGSRLAGVLVSAIRLMVLGGVIVYAAIDVLPADMIPQLAGAERALLAAGVSLGIGMIIFILALPARDTAVSGIFALEAMAAVVVGILVILALAALSVFATEVVSPNTVFLLLIGGIYIFYVFLIIRRGLALQVENESLRQKYGELRELDEEKTDFVTVTSHQLRTPLNEIKWILGYAIGQEMSEDARKALQKGIVATDRMVGIVNSILRARTLDLKDSVIERKELDLGTIVAGVVDAAREFAREKGVTLVYYPPESPTVLHGAQEELGLAIENIVDNAIRYAPNGTVTVSLQTSQASAQIRVEDTGIGIAPEDRDRVFRKFYRAQNALRIQPDGTGIGLSIAKKLVERNGGTISFVSELGKGTKFLITLPLRPSGT